MLSGLTPRWMQLVLTCSCLELFVPPPRHSKSPPLANDCANQRLIASVQGKEQSSCHLPLRLLSTLLLYTPVAQHSQCVCACVRACVRACVCVRARACVCVRSSVNNSGDSLDEIPMHADLSQQVKGHMEMLLLLSLWKLFVIPLSLSPCVSSAGPTPKGTSGRGPA